MSVQYSTVQYSKVQANTPALALLRVKYHILVTFYILLSKMCRTVKGNFILLLNL